MTSPVLVTCHEIMTSHVMVTCHEIMILHVMVTCNRIMTLIFNRIPIVFTLIYYGIPMERFLKTLIKCQTRNLQLDFERGRPVGK